MTSQCEVCHEEVDLTTWGWVRSTNHDTAMSVVTGVPTSVKYWHTKCFPVPEMLDGVEDKEGVEVNRGG